jgi:hypothetical protein
MWFAANAATQINNAQGFGFDIEVKNNPHSHKCHQWFLPQ